MSVARWLEFSSLSIPFAATVFTAAVFKLSGVVDVLLFMLTRPNLLLFRGRREQQQQQSRPVSTPERQAQPRISDIQIQVEVRERPPTSATPILIASPSPSVASGRDGLPDSPNSFDTGDGSFNGVFKPLTLDLPTPRISSIFQAWEDLQRVERVHEIREADPEAGSLAFALSVAVNRTSSRRTGSTSSKSQNGIMLGGRRSRLGFRKALPSPLPSPHTPEPPPALDPVAKQSEQNRNRDSTRMSQVWTNVPIPNEALGKNPSVARVSATFTAQTHLRAGPGISAPKRTENVDPPVTSLQLATAHIPSRLPIGPRSPPLRQKVRPRTSLEVPSSTSHYIPTSQALLISSHQRTEPRIRLRPRSQIVGSTHPHYLRASQALSDSAQQQQHQQYPRGPRPRPLTTQPSNSSPHTDPPPSFSPDTRVEENSPLPKPKDPEFALESFTMTTSTSSSEALSRLAADFPVPPQHILPPPPPLPLPQTMGTLGLPQSSTRRDTTRREEGDYRIPQRRSVPPEPVTVAGSQAEGCSAMRVVQAEVNENRDRTGGTTGTAHRSSRSAEREARRKAKGKQRADYVSFMDVSYQAFIIRHN